VTTGLDANAPAVGYPAAPGQLVLSGLGVPKGATVAEQNLEHLEIRYGMSHGTLGAVEEKPVALNELEHWTTQVERSEPASAESEGFEERELVLGELGVGFIVRPDGTRVPAVLHSRRVTVPVEI